MFQYHHSIRHWLCENTTIYAHSVSANTVICAHSVSAHKVICAHSVCVNGANLLKMLSLNSVSSTHTATLEIWWHLIQIMTNLKNEKNHFRVEIGVRVKIKLEIVFKIYKLYLSWKSCSPGSIFEWNRVTWKICSPTRIGMIKYNKVIFWNLVQKI